ncbi:MAG: M1 family aminopeptidase [Acidobacteriota bacterium]
MKSLKNLSVIKFVPVLMAVAITGIPTTSPAEGLDPSNAIDNYRRLMEWKFSSETIAVPEEGISFSRDCGAWVLESGKIRLMEPLSNGAVTGLVFEGKGRFQMTIPDPIEVNQVKRFSGQSSLNKIETTFTRLLLRTSEDLIYQLVTIPMSSAYAPDRLAKDRQEVWLRLAFLDIDARVLAGLLNAGDEFLFVDMKTNDFGWLAFSFDRLQNEEIQLHKQKENFDFIETWVSLDRASDRQASGRPTHIRRDQMDVTHLDIEVDLTKWIMNISWRLGEPSTIDTAKFRSTVTFQPLMDGQQAIELTLNPEAVVDSVSTPEGQELRFIREPIGKRFISLGKDNNDESLLIILDEPTVRGKEKKIVVGHRMKMSNYVSGNDWYPCLGGNINDLHTVRLKVMHNQKYSITAVGKREQETIQDKIKTTIWSTEVPTKMYGFTVGEKFDEEKVKLEGVPEVISFGVSINRNMVKNVAIDVARSLHFYKWLLDVDFPCETMYATCIDSYHGQSFDGFLHLSEYTFDSEHPGATELFRAHEVAHQMWGHMVGWKSYRDQWLSEAFAEYSAMLYVETAMPKDKYFYEILETYTNMLIGSLKSSFSKFSRPWLTEYAIKRKEKIGPISLGYRAGSAEAPGVYFMQSYHKGPLVLHMLRILLRNSTKSEEMFRTILKDFLHTYKGQAACTDDFQRIVEKHSKEDWSWFFNQWVHGSAIPLYTWTYTVSDKPNEKGLYNIEVKVKQSDVPEDFKMFVPIRIELDDKTVKQIVVPVDQPEKPFTLMSQKKPREIFFNPDHAVLAEVKKK